MWCYFIQNSFLDDTMKLVISERQSLHALTYMSLIIMAYFGPNAEFLGNIKLKIWQYQNPITDIEAYIYNVGLWLSVDFLSLVINGILVWNFCKVNILGVVQNLQKECWMIFALAEAWIFMEVRLHS